MSDHWYSLFLRQIEPATAAGVLQAVFAARGYQPYDPFPGGTGTPADQRERVRLFVAPPHQGWVRVLGQPDDAALPDLSRRLDHPLLLGWLDEQGGGFALFKEGERHARPDDLAHLLRPDKSVEHLHEAWAGTLHVPVVDAHAPVGPVLPGRGTLPPEIEQFAHDHGVDTQKAGKLAQRVSESLFGKLGQQPGEESDEQRQAREVVMGGGRDAWNSLDGQRVRAIASVLVLPDNWRVPTWDQVREAYQIHRLRQRNPRIPLLPGDEEILRAVPDALDYLPVYMGRP